MASGTSTATLSGHTKSVLSVCFSPDGRTLATGSHDKSLKLWNVANGSCVFSTSLLFVADDVLFPDASRCLAASSSGAEKVSLCCVSGVWSVEVPPPAIVQSAASSCRSCDTLRADVRRLEAELAASAAETQLVKSQASAEVGALKVAHSADVRRLEAELAASATETHQLKSQLVAFQAALEDGNRQLALVAEAKLELERQLAAAMSRQPSAPLFDPCRPYAWSASRFPSGTRVRFELSSPHCESNIKAWVSGIMQSCGHYSHGLAPSPVAGFSVHHVDIIADADGLDALESLKNRLKSVRSTRLREVVAVEDAVNRDAEMLRVVGELKSNFLTRGGPREANVLLVFHGTRVDCVDTILSAGLLKRCTEDDGYFGYGCYTTPSLEYAARYATGELSDPPVPRTTDADGCYPVIAFAALVGLAYPVTRSNGYANPGDRFSKSKFFGKPLFNAAVDTHVVGVAAHFQYECAPVDEVQYLEIASTERLALCPVAVFWVKQS